MKTEEGTILNMNENINKVLKDDQHVWVLLRGESGIFISMPMDICITHLSVGDEPALQKP